MNGLSSLGYIAQQPHKNTKHRYIHFSQNTEGRCGRPVFIDAQLLPDFLSAVDITSYAGLEVVKQIEQLRAVGGGIHSHQNKDFASKHKNLAGKVEVHYYIAQANEGNSGGVYITSVINVNKGRDEPGLYRFADGSIKKHESDYFALEQACVGSCDSIETLTNRAKPYVSPDDWNSIKYELFFTPNYDTDKHGTWITPTQKKFNESKSAVELANILQKTQLSLLNRSNAFIKIRIFDNSSKVLDQSLKLIKGHIDKLGFEFIDPEGSITSAINQLTSKNAKLSRSPVQITSRGSLISLAKVRSQVSCALRNAERALNATEVLEKTRASSVALSIGSSLSHHKNNFLTAARQANLLGKWQS